MMISPHALKAKLPPELYYGRHLAGSFGKATGSHWHQWNGLCPFHGDTRPGSFVINKASGAFKCFSCGASGGDLIAFHMRAYRLSFRQALNQLQGIAQCGK